MDPTSPDAMVNQSGSASKCMAGCSTKRTSVEATASIAFVDGRTWLVLMHWWDRVVRKNEGTYFSCLVERGGWGSSCSGVAGAERGAPHPPPAAPAAKLPVDLKQANTQSVKLEVLKNEYGVCIWYLERALFCIFSRYCTGKTLSITMSLSINNIFVY